jgi:hypothetical protein
MQFVWFSKFAKKDTFGVTFLRMGGGFSTWLRRLSMAVEHA